MHFFVLAHQLAHRSKIRQMALYSFSDVGHFFHKNNKTLCIRRNLLPLSLVRSKEGQAKCKQRRFCCLESFSLRPIPKFLVCLPFLGLFWPPSFSAIYIISFLFSVGCLPAWSNHPWTSPPDLVRSSPRSQNCQEAIWVCNEFALVCPKCAQYSM